MKNDAAPDPAPAVERRSGFDRRRVDRRPPGGYERRRGIEPRQPEIVELALSESQWQALVAGEPLPR